MVSEAGGPEQRLERAIDELLSSRADGATICPSEAARAVGGEDWRPLMGPARAVAGRMAARGEVEVTQRGEVVDVDRARGPIRIRRAGGADSDPRSATADGDA